EEQGPPRTTRSRADGSRRAPRRRGASWATGRGGHRLRRRRPRAGGGRRPEVRRLVRRAARRHPREARRARGGVIASKEDQRHREVVGEGPPVVLVHAGICDSRMWDPQWESFRRAHRVVRYDLRGFGRSPLVPGRYSPPGELIAPLDELALGPAALVGASMGGGISLQVAVARPDLVSALVLVGSGVRG